MIRLMMFGDPLMRNAATLVQEIPYGLHDTESCRVVTVGAAAVTVLTVNAALVNLGARYRAHFTNESTLGQRIGISSEAIPTLATCGQVLNPGESWLADNISISLQAIADAAGGALRIFPWQSRQP